LPLRRARRYVASGHASVLLVERPVSRARLAERRNLVELGAGRRPCHRDRIRIKQIFEIALAGVLAIVSRGSVVSSPRDRCDWLRNCANRGEIRCKADDELINGFRPPTPDPASGFLLFVPKRDLIG
jgi:hypothetical protein